MHKVYVQRRLMLFSVIILAIAIIAFALSLSPAIVPNQKPSNQTPANFSSLPIFERPPKVVEPVVVNDTNDTPADACAMDVPIETFQYLGCLERNNGSTIFDADGMQLDDRSVKRVINKVEATCDTDDIVDRDCIVHTTVTQSESSWVCEWACLQDMASCETYKMHLAVAVLRNYVPAIDVFVGRTDKFEFFMIYKNNNGEWIQPQYTFLDNPDVVAIYNDVYHAGPMTEVVFPEITEVKPGDDFCFDVYADRSCVCTVEATTFTVGDCPQLPADLRGICDAPVTEVYLRKGKNPICFTIDEDAEEEFYTYKFDLTGGEDYIPAGNAFIKEKKWDCCVNASLEGFLAIQD